MICDEKYQEGYFELHHLSSQFDILIIPKKIAPLAVVNV